MKKIVFFFLMLIVTNACLAQLSATPSKSEAWKKFISSKTYFVSSGDKIFNDALAKAAAEIWKLTPVIMIDTNAVKEKVKDTKASFIMLFSIPSSVPGKEYHLLGLVMGGKKTLGEYGYNDLLAFAPINHAWSEPKNTDCYYRLPNMLQSMESVQLLVQEDQATTSITLANAMFKYYRAKANYIKDRTLLVCKEDLGEKLDEETFRALYPYPVEFCSKSKISEAIAAIDNKYYYLQPAITLNKSIFVFDPATGEVVYGVTEIIGTHVTKGNIEDLVATIEGKE